MASHEKACRVSLINISIAIVYSLFRHAQKHLFSFIHQNKKAFGNLLVLFFVFGVYIFSYSSRSINTLSKKSVDNSA
jgi:hypothetical protein